MKACFSPRAREDVLEQLRFYLDERHAPQVAERLLDAVEQAAEQVRCMPHIGAPKHLDKVMLKGLRARGSPICVFTIW